MSWLWAYVCEIPYQFTILRHPIFKICHVPMLYITLLSFIFLTIYLYITLLSYLSISLFYYITLLSFIFLTIYLYNTLLSFIFQTIYLYITLLSFIFLTIYLYITLRSFIFLTIYLYITLLSFIFLTIYLSVHKIHSYLWWPVENNKWILCCRKMLLNVQYLRFLMYKWLIKSLLYKILWINTII